MPSPCGLKQQCMLQPNAQESSGTYRAHLVDATVATVNSVDHLHQLQILPLLEVGF